MIFDALTREYGGYIFDCDGTLANSMVVHNRAWLLALSAHGATFDFHWELFVSRAGMTLPHTVRELNEQFGITLDAASVIAAQRREYEKELATVQPIAEVVELALRVAKSHPVSVASGGERDEASGQHAQPPAPEICCKPNMAREKGLARSILRPAASGNS